MKEDIGYEAVMGFLIVIYKGKWIGKQFLGLDILGLDENL